ncbi:hypothetical protein PQE70_gp054 [Bacillus phage vB_BanS_Nate]|uniref:Uncharacterized protein n=1 Tax=Bacillus phage vB_BanS_Nate TaxID=2894788 RepID=A0AAE8YXZ9_9CAUD|nr:hypothetical protein PQE70_gp054 [Bacillus phage vB_BanS_Nate]UGO50907.1 hypothetical protein NATE_54 [Bacillus phage vB_BanS_Nate]
MGKWNKLRKQIQESLVKLKDEYEMEAVHTLECVLLDMEYLEAEEDKPMFEVIHMCCYDIFDKNPSEEQVKEIGVKIKELYYHDAMKWDWDDTEVRDNVYVWIKKNVKQ